MSRGGFFILFFFLLLGGALLIRLRPWQAKEEPRILPLSPPPCPPPPPCPLCPASTSSTRRCLVVYVLFGHADRFLLGALRNAEQVPYVYPGAKALFLLHPEVNQTMVAELRSRHALIEVLTLDQQTRFGIRDMPFHAWRSWRYLAPDVRDDWDMMLFRDVDSRLSMRERAAVEEWLQSPHLGFHVMRDHSHHPWPILAGTFGMRKAAYRALPWNFTRLLQTYRDYDKPYFFDQAMLGRVVWPQIRNQTRVHDAIYCMNTELRGAITTGFPTKREWDNTIVGNQVHGNDEPVTRPGEVAPYECRRYPSWTMG